MKGVFSLKNKNISFKIGHVLIQVNHLETAIHEYRQMGFQVVSGGPPGKAHNALIYLKDGSFLELFCTNHGTFINALLEVMVDVIGFFSPSYSSRLGLYLPKQEGLRDYALDSVPGALYQENIRKIRENKLNISNPRSKSRVDRHGIRLSWTLSCPKSIFLPFLMSEYHPSAMIEDENVSHPNGALGIQVIEIATNQWENTYHEYALLLGIEPHITYAQTGRSCIFSIRGTDIHLLEKAENGIACIILFCNRQLEKIDTYAATPPFILMNR